MQKLFPPISPKLWDFHSKSVTIRSIVYKVITSILPTILIENTFNGTVNHTRKILMTCCSERKIQNKIRTTSHSRIEESLKRYTVNSTPEHKSALDIWNHAWRREKTRRNSAFFVFLSESKNQLVLLWCSFFWSSSIALNQNSNFYGNLRAHFSLY